MALTITTPLGPFAKYATVASGRWEHQIRGFTKTTAPR
jgi:hypothetical protein